MTASPKLLNRLELLKAFVLRNGGDWEAIVEAIALLEQPFKRRQSTICSRHRLGDIDSTCKLCFPPVELTDWK